MEFFKLDAEFLANDRVPIKKYVSTREGGSGLNAYFVEIDSQVINGYFCFGVDHPDASGIESLLLHFDSSMGLVPKPLRGDTLRPAWQFHGSENSLSDRDQSCYICTALGEKSFQGVFGCAILMLENMEHVFMMGDEEPKVDAEENRLVTDPKAPQDVAFGDVDPEVEIEPKIRPDEVYCLSEAGEGAMAWEGTLQLMFPGVKSFRNRLLSSGDGTISNELVNCYYNFYRPDNLSIVVTGKLEDNEKILNTIASYEKEYHATHPVSTFIRPWTFEIPKVVYSKNDATSVARFFPRNPNREPTATLCIGWRGSQSKDIETSMALKVITAHLAVGPLWTQFVASGLVQRISWCQLEYIECCSLITMHGISSDEVCEKICRETDSILDDLGDEQKNMLQLDEIEKMAERVGWHHVREFEADPFLVLASAISKGERYGLGEQQQVEKRLNPLPVYLELKKKPLGYWKNLIRTYFIGGGTFSTKVLPNSYDKPEAPAQTEGASVESAEAQPFTSSSRRASSRPRRRSSAVGEETNVLSGSGPENPTAQTSPRIPAKEVQAGHLEQLLKDNAFPFGERSDELDEFKERLQGCAQFIDDVAGCENRFFPIETYRSDEANQNLAFPVGDMPFFTFLEDIQTSFIYATIVLDTTHLDTNMRKFIAPITAALGAIICPRPPGLDTDSTIENPSEFNPPRRIVDSQVSLGVNGEMMQNIFIMLIVRPENYDWAVGMFHYLLYKPEFAVNFLKFIGSEAIKGLASNYRMQTAEVPNYDCFDASEINLHSLVEMIYTPDSNANLFVGRRRLDAMNEFMSSLEKNPEGTRDLLTEAWRKIVDRRNLVVQLGMDVQKVSNGGKIDLVAPWKTYFTAVEKPWKVTNGTINLESELMLKPKGSGIAVAVNHTRPPCLTTAIQIHPNSDDFPKLCIASQLFSMAQKWVFACFGEEDSGIPVLRMPCSYSHLLTLNLESNDVIGFLKLMKRVINEDWEWIDPLMTTTKQLVINDPALMDNGPQGTIMMALLAHLSGVSISDRRKLLTQSLKVSKEDVKEVIQKYLVKLFDPKESWYALMSDGMDQEPLIERLQELGYNFTKRNLQELCTQL